MWATCSPFFLLIPQMTSYLFDHTQRITITFFLKRLLHWFNLFFPYGLFNFQIELILQKWNFDICNSFNNDKRCVSEASTIEIVRVQSKKTFHVLKLAWRTYPLFWVWFTCCQKVVNSSPKTVFLNRWARSSFWWATKLLSFVQNRNCIDKFHEIHLKVSLFATKASISNQIS